MRRRSLLLALIMSAGALLATKEAPMSMTAAEAVTSYQSFALAFARTAFQRKANAVYAPFGLASLTQVLNEGAKGETAKELRTLLRIPEGRSEALRAFGVLYQGIRNDAKKGAGNYKLEVANRAWASRDWTPAAALSKSVAEYLSADVGSYDLRDPERARRELNGWFAAQTGDAIKDLVAPGALKADSRFVLTSAQYFAGEWSRPFKPELTRDESFRPESGAAVTVPFMRQVETLRYADLPTLQALELDYRGKDLCMTLLLPKASHSAGEMVDAWASVMASLAERRVEVVLPKFNFETSSDVRELIGEMGAKKAFTPQADYGGIGEGAKVAGFVQKTLIAVDERGTVAASGAATVMVTAEPRPAEPVRFRADHPFLFVIRHKPSSLILFAGRVESPRR